MRSRAELTDEKKFERNTLALFISFAVMLLSGGFAFFLWGCFPKLYILTIIAGLIGIIAAIILSISHANVLMMRLNHLTGRKRQEFMELR